MKCQKNIREEFIDTCNLLSKVTTVSNYNILTEKLEEMAARVPQLYIGLNGGMTEGHIYLVPTEEVGYQDVTCQNKEMLNGILQIL